MEKLTGRQLKDKSNANAYFHYAILDNLDESATKDDVKYGRASCVTVVPPYKGRSIYYVRREGEGGSKK